MESHKSDSRVIIVTGANKGIGFSIIDHLLGQSGPYIIILAARDLVRGKKAVEELCSKHKRSASKVVYEQLDVTDIKSVADFTDRIKAKYGRVDALVNNAGIATITDHVEDSLAVLRTNIYGLISVTESLLPLISEDAKIINMSSSMAILNMHKPRVRVILNNEKLTEKEFHDLLDKTYEKAKQNKQTELGFADNLYIISKAFVNTYTRIILARKLKGNQQTFAVDPGFTSTDINHHKGYRHVSEGAATPAWLIGLPWKRDDRLHAQFIRDKEVIDHCVDTYDLGKMGFNVHNF